MKDYFDSTILANPLYEYIKWITTKIYYQTKNWGKHLRIGYNAYIRRTTFGRYNYVGKNVLLSESELGDFTYIASGSIITNSSIGKFCSIGPNVKSAPGRHPTSKIVSTHPALFSKFTPMNKTFATENRYLGNKKVKIGNDVWIGANCLIVDGITIGDGAVIAANSVVTKNVGPYSIVGGVPCKLIKKRFEESEIQRLLNMKWWDKDDEWIEKNIKSFWDINEFINL